MTGIIEMIDREIGKLESAKNVLTSDFPNPTTNITPAALLSAVDRRDFPQMFANTHGDQPRKKKGRSMSPEGRAAVAAAQKARWAKKKAEEKKAQRNA